MDPDACLNELLEALSDRDFSAAFDRAEALRDWIANGGFLPGGGKLRKTSLEAGLGFIFQLLDADESLFHDLDAFNEDPPFDDDGDDLDDTVEL